MSSRLTHANAGAALAERIIELGGENAAVDYLAAWLADGGSMQEFCVQNGLNWGTVHAWIRKSPERNDRYRQAMIDRGALRRERLLDGWWKVADSKVEEPVTHGDVQKARDSLAKAEGLFKDEAVGMGVSAVIDAGLMFAAHELLARVQRPKVVDGAVIEGPVIEGPVTEGGE